MGLISGLVMGTLLGIGIMAGWSRMMQYRSRKRISKAADIKLLGSLSRDDLKKICGDNFPEWISFPQYAQVKWLNKHLSKLWPFIAQAAAVVAKESVEPLLDDYRPAGITSMKFSKFSLGNVAPKIEGIRIQNLQPGQITMDIDFRWGGDPSIILAVEAAMVASLPIQLKDLQVFTVARVVFQLSEEIPCISAVVFALLADPKPRIEYTLKAVGGSLTAIPGLSDKIDDTVNSIVTDMLEWPHRLVIPLGVNVDTSELELKPHGMLSMKVIRASSLMNKELVGKSDPYVILYIRPMFKSKTKVIDDNLDPEWNECFEMIVEDKETQSVIFEIFDEDKLQTDKKLGITKLALNSLEPDTPKEFSLKVLESLDTVRMKDKRDRGILYVQAAYHQFTKEEQLAAVELEKRAIEEKKRLKAAGVIGSTMDAVGGAASLVGSGVGLVGTGVFAGVGLVGTGVGAGVGLVGTGLEAGVGLVGSGVGLVGSGFGAMGSGLTKAGKFMGKNMTSHFSSKKMAGSSSTAARADEPPTPKSDK